MGIKSGVYTICYGKEYRIARIENRYKIISNDERDLNKGFIKYRPEKSLNPRVFFKMVSPSEIRDAYEISAFCFYHGFEFHTTYDDGENYVSASDYGPLVEKSNFIRINEFGYEKIVPKDEVDLMYEKKGSITDFFG